ncbi:hypothetical protein PHSY_000261 [Pseudozyma hubeiensis SY62]|uniref:DUF1682-domain-containing protein n=1 Tax=Pseudozyma hubeiensis (strain SY62) TaxID=1305764 RepID=R9NW65_PSEHS|nr:hypothetical protein PHSY_000261 [Pseudozyma hubeiensis SY62]GAC92706.1 hypothetical protein PHSY_000261 [Pseudozyma hubeiensis SY62]
MEEKQHQDARTSNSTRSSSPSPSTLLVNISVAVMVANQLGRRASWLSTGAVFAMWTMLLLAAPSSAFELPSFLKSTIAAQNVNNVNRPTGATAYQANQPYDGLEFPLVGRFVFRPALFWLEGGVLGFCLLFILIHLVGKTRNRQMASKFASAALPVLEQEFAVIANDEGKGHLLWNGGNEALMFASGRRGCASLQVTFDLIPRHDPMEILFAFVKDTVTASITPLRDAITLTFTLPTTADNVSGVFALVNKGALQYTRSGRFDLTFAKVIDSDSAVTSRGLSKQWAIMSEAPELTDAFLGEPDQKGVAQRTKLGLVDLLEGKAGAFLDSLVLTDQPFKRPTKGPIPIEQRQRLLTLTLQAPKSTADAHKAIELLQFGCNLVDALDQGVVKLRNETLNKLRKTRAQVDKELLDESTKEQREAEQEAREEAKRKAEKEKFDKLSPAEQAKRKEVERKRAMKKGSQKVR